jgi:hypothetical protein
MKSFAASSLLVLFLIVGGFCKPASAQALKYTYTGLPFSVGECQSGVSPVVNFAASNSIPFTINCINGSITGSFTIPDDAVASGSVNPSQITSWSLSGPLGTFSSGGNSLVAGSVINFSGLTPTSWYLASAVETTSASGGSGSVVGTISGVSNPGGDGDEAAAFTVTASPTPSGSATLGFIFAPPTGAWSLTANLLDVLKALGLYAGSICAGDPCNVGTGNEQETITDYTTTGQNPLAFIRYYNSLATTDPYATELGSNWRNNYDRYLTVSATTVSAERGDGQVLTFTSNGSGGWTSDSDIDITLTNAGTTWTLTDHNDSVETYTQSMSGEALLQRVVA